MVSSSLVFSGKAVAAELGGSFKTTGYNNPIQLTDLALTQFDPLTETQTLVTSLTPTSQYRISFTVSDYDGLDTLSIEVGLIHDPMGFVDENADGIDDDFEAPKGITEDADQFDLFYNTTMVEEGPQLFITEGTTTSWALVNHNVSGLTQGLLTYTFTFDFIVSKAAPFGEDWTLNVRVMDDDAIPNTTVAYERIDKLQVQWYGEIVTDPLSSFNWGTIATSTDYNHPSAKQSATLRYLSNGAYERLVSADALWSGQRQDTTALGHQGDTISADLVDDVSTQADQSFSIRINEVDSPEQGPNAGYIQLSSINRLISESLLKTSEMGSFQEFTLYLRLSEHFQNGLYQGTIRFGIANKTLTP
jgi:hypothetical protein